MKKVSLILSVLILVFLTACNNGNKEEEKLKEEIKNGPTQETKPEDFQWEGTYKYNNQKVTFKPDGSIDATGDFPYNRYMVMKKKRLRNKCNWISIYGHCRIPLQT